MEPIPKVAGFSMADRGPQGAFPFWIAEGRGAPTIGHLAFTAPDRATVDAFHAAALAAGGRLQLPPGKGVLGGRRRHSMGEAQATAAFPPGFVERNPRAMGLPLPDPDQPVSDDEQAENLKTLLAMMEAGEALKGVGDRLEVAGRDRLVGADPPLDLPVRCAVDGARGPRLLERLV